LDQPTLSSVSIDGHKLNKIIVKIKEKILKVKLHQLIIGVIIVVFISFIRYIFALESIDLIWNLQDIFCKYNNGRLWLSY